MGERVVVADYLIDCAGIDRDTRKCPDPLVGSLIAQGLAKPDKHGLGFSTAGDGRLIGRGLAPIYTIGPWRRGELWESIAVPELRVQAEAVAAAVLERLFIRSAADSSADRNSDPRTDSEASEC
jgi:uncharacterized NAD(P)/FAD-binding protein YdhS